MNNIVGIPDHRGFAPGEIFGITKATPAHVICKPAVVAYSFQKAYVRWKKDLRSVEGIGQAEVAVQRVIEEPAPSAIEEPRLRGFIRALRNAETFVPCQGVLQGREGCGRYLEEHDHPNYCRYICCHEGVKGPKEVEETNEEEDEG